MESLLDAKVMILKRLLFSQTSYNNIIKIHFLFLNRLAWNLYFFSKDFEKMWNKGKKGKGKDTIYLFIYSFILI